MIDAAIQIRSGAVIHLIEQKNGTLYVTISNKDEWMEFSLTNSDADTLTVFLNAFVKHTSYVDI